MVHFNELVKLKLEHKLYKAIFRGKISLSCNNESEFYNKSKGIKVTFIILIIWNY